MWTALDVTAITGMFLNAVVILLVAWVKRDVQQVHTIVNSNLLRIEAKLQAAEDKVGQLEQTVRELKQNEP